MSKKLQENLATEWRDTLAKVRVYTNSLLVVSFCYLSKIELQHGKTEAMQSKQTKERMMQTNNKVRIKEKWKISCL